MDFKPTPKDTEILSFLCKNFQCKICNSILIQCVKLACGHQYCNYCLDMLVGEKCQQCPQCPSPIKFAQPNDAVDQKIDQLIHSCSKPIHKAYTVALNTRFQKSLERSKSKNDARLQQHKNCFSDQGGKISSSSNFDDICKALLSRGSVNSEQALTQALKSARKFSPHRSSLSDGLTSRTRHEQQRPGSRRSRESSRFSHDISTDKVESLFGIYDHFLQSDNEPKRELAGGDFTREGDRVAKMKMEPTRRSASWSDIQIATLIKEADDIVKLDDHVQQWTNKMRSALTVNSRDDQSDASDVIREDGYIVKDELWRSSNQLLNKLRGIQSDRQSIRRVLSTLTLPTLPPPPRSAMLDVDSISDDSDIEEYEESFDELQRFIEEPISVGQGNTPRRNSTAPNQSNQIEPYASKRKSDAMVEFGNTYAQENTKFITKVRKCKDALMKIQNGEVETPQEIMDLIPDRTVFPNDVASPILNKPRIAVASPSPSPASRHIPGPNLSSGPRHSPAPAPRLNPAPRLSSTPRHSPAPAPAPRLNPAPRLSPAPRHSPGPASARLTGPSNRFPSKSPTPQPRVTRLTHVKPGLPTQLQQQPRPQHPFSSRFPTSISRRPQSATYDMSSASPQPYPQRLPNQIMVNRTNLYMNNMKRASPGRSLFTAR